jgi:CRISPR-associated exonuclease Cas4
MYEEEDLLQMSGIQHFCFCKRQWALIHVEQSWEDSARTKEGDILHKNADDPFYFEKRGNTLISRAIPVRSLRLGLSGICDVVEFVKSEDGTAIKNRNGRYTVCPIEYKVGAPKQNDADAVQLCAQAMALEEMLNTDIQAACMYYEKTRRRLDVEIDDRLREETQDLADEMHKIMRYGKTPMAVRTNACAACSLLDLCVPKLSEAMSIHAYMTEMDDQ